MNYLPANILRWLLVQAGQLGDPRIKDPVTNVPTQAWPGYYSVEPSLPDNCVTLFNTEGQSDGRGMIDGQLYYHYGFQVRIRGTDDLTAGDKAENLRQYLAKSIKRTRLTMPDGLTQYTVHCISGISQVVPLGQDVPNDQRYIFIVNGSIALAYI